MEVQIVSEAYRAHLSERVFVVRVDTVHTIQIVVTDNGHGCMHTKTLGGPRKGGMSASEAACRAVRKLLNAGTARAS